MAETICNTSPLQYLFQVDLLDLLPSLYGEVIVPEAVLVEIADGRRQGVVLPDIESLPWAQVGRAKEQALLPILTDLGPGEREVLALAVERPGSLALLDDRLARRYALHLGLKFTGTLGILLLAKRGGRLRAVAPVLDELDRRGFRLDAGTRSVVLKLSGESPAQAPSY